MRTLLAVLQCALALGLLDVWLLRARQPTAYRGGTAASMGEEFAAYGLPDLCRYLVGFLELAAVVPHLVGVWVPVVVPPSAFVVGALMLGALAMQIKVGDPVRTSVPALLVPAMRLAVALGSAYMQR